MAAFSFVLRCLDHVPVSLVRSSSLVTVVPFLHVEKRMLSSVLPSLIAGHRELKSVLGACSCDVDRDSQHRRPFFCCLPALFANSVQHNLLVLFRSCCAGCSCRRGWGGCSVAGDRAPASAIVRLAIPLRRHAPRALSLAHLRATLLQLHLRRRRHRRRPLHRRAGIDTALDLAWAQHRRSCGIAWRVN